MSSVSFIAKSSSCFEFNISFSFGSNGAHNHFRAVTTCSPFRLKKERTRFRIPFVILKVKTLQSDLRNRMYVKIEFQWCEVL